jgi:hypothetical protein
MGEGLERVRENVMREHYVSRTSSFTLCVSRITESFLVDTNLKDNRRQE